MERTAQKEDVNKFRVELKSQGIEEVSRQKNSPTLISSILSYALSTSFYHKLYNKSK